MKDLTVVRTYWIQPPKPPNPKLDCWDTQVSGKREGSGAFTLKIDAAQQWRDIRLTRDQTEALRNMLNEVLEDWNEDDLHDGHAGLDRL